MRHLLKIKCVDSRVNVNEHFSFNKCPINTPDGASAKYSTNSHETDNSVHCKKFLRDSWIDFDQTLQGLCVMYV